MPDIEKITKITPTYLSDLKKVDHKKLERIKDIKPLTYKMITGERKENFWTKLRATIAGETTVGVVLGEVKNIVKHFVPFGYAADSLTDEIANRIKPTYKYNTMEKAKSKSKTIIIFGLLFLAGLLESLGVELGLELSPDAKWVMVGAGVVGVILRLVTDKPVKLGKVLKTITGKD